MPRFFTPVPLKTETDMMMVALTVKSSTDKVSLTRCVSITTFVQGQLLWLCLVCDPYNDHHTEEDIKLSWYTKFKSAVPIECEFKRGYGTPPDCNGIRKLYEQLKETGKVEKDISLDGVGGKLTSCSAGLQTESQEIHLPRKYGVTDVHRFLQSSLQTIKIAYSAGT
jgi:hypothetical protein